METFQATWLGTCQCEGCKRDWTTFFFFYLFLVLVTRFNMCYRRLEFLRLAPVSRNMRKLTTMATYLYLALPGQPGKP